MGMEENIMYDVILQLTGAELCFVMWKGKNNCVVTFDTNFHLAVAHS